MPHVQIQSKQDQIFACDLNAIAAEERQTHSANVKIVFQRVQETRELENGYAIRLPNESNVVRVVAEFIARERLCCPFFGFAMEIEPNGGPLWLRLTGSEGAKEFMLAEFDGLSNKNILT